MNFFHKITAVAASLKPYEEYLLSGLFVLVGSYAYIEARAWGFAAGTWPRLTAGIVIVLSTLVFVQRFLPERLQSLIVEGETMFSRRQKQATGDNDTAEPTQQSHDDTAETNHRIHDPDDESVSSAVVTALFTIGYATLGYLVGFLWATPVFVFAYSQWNAVAVTKSAALAAVGFGIAYGFVFALAVPIDGGVLTELILP
ncbi:tripartite tricarboxylate transporter TctB family protein [Natronoglomus mannanivorans]|uniref:Tripartite tricarboxylate transporter TctB family protein n=1 Tax=Natronoglomus mannanivorans TaxID=2979990 RepID=A0AAP2Z3D5_9EURY|nr:tripartite tricarboxylate transporter TctB family protein [Halobacteria archaeon AArc-xg1-1]